MVGIADKALCQWLEVVLSFSLCYWASSWHFYRINSSNHLLDHQFSTLPNSSKKKRLIYGKVLKRSQNWAGALKFSHIGNTCVLEDARRSPLAAAQRLCVPLCLGLLDYLPGDMQIPSSPYAGQKQHRESNRKNTGCKSKETQLNELLFPQNQKKRKKSMIICLHNREIFWWH